MNHSDKVHIRCSVWQSELLINTNPNLKELLIAYAFCLILGVFHAWCNSYKG